MLLSGGACPSSVALCFKPSNVVLEPFSPSPSGWLVASNYCRKRTLPNVCPRGARADSVAQVLKKLAHFNRPFKYIGTPIPQPLALSLSFTLTCCSDVHGSSEHRQLHPHGAHVSNALPSLTHAASSVDSHSASCFWDTETDGIAHPPPLAHPFAMHAMRCCVPAPAPALSSRNCG